MSIDDEFMGLCKGCGCLLLIVIVPICGTIAWIAWLFLK